MDTALAPPTGTGCARPHRVPRPERCLTVRTAGEVGGPNAVDIDAAVVWHRSMAIVLERPGVDTLGQVLSAHRRWQRDDASMQLHPGDLGWQWRFGADALVACVRTWSRDGELLALGYLDEPTVLRLAIAPEAQRDEELAHRLADDIAGPERRVLAEGRAALAVTTALVGELLITRGWVQQDESWTQLRLDLSNPRPDLEMRVEIVSPDRVQERTAVQRAAFDNSTFTEDRWQAMAAGPLYADARCLLLYDAQDTAVAAATVWSAGAGRPGLIEPLGVHRDHRGQGHGKVITLAAAAALQQLGSSCTLVCTPTANIGAVAAYLSAGFQKLAEVHDLTRPVVSSQLRQLQQV